MKSPKLYFFCITFLFLIPAVYSNSPVSFFTPEKPEVSVTQRFEYSFLHDFKYDNIGASTIANVDANELQFTGGFNACSKSTDIAVETIYAPCLLNFWSFGICAKYHYYKYSDVFAEHNAVGSFYTNFNINNVWNIYLKFGAAGKFTIINSYPNNIRINETNYYFDTGCFFTPFDQWKFFLTISSSSLFEDNIIGVFIFDTGFDFRYSKLISLGSDVYFKWEDASIPFDSFSQLTFRVNWSVHF